MDPFSHCFIMFLSKVVPGCESVVLVSPGVDRSGILFALFVMLVLVVAVTVVTALVVGRTGLVVGGLLGWVVTTLA